MIIDNAENLLPIEIKSGRTINSDFFKNLDYFKKITGFQNSLLVYNGELAQKRSNGNEVINWRNISIF